MANVFAYSTDKQGSRRTITINGAEYAYGAREAADGEDRFGYTLPNGKEYTHPTAEGCLLMILKHASVHNS